MECIQAPPTVNVCPCPNASPMVPTIPPCVPAYPVCPQNVHVPLMTPGEPQLATQEKKKKCKYIQPVRPKSFAPIRKFAPPQVKMSDNTVYRKSYLPCDNERVEPIRPNANICVGEGKFTKDTINKLSYKGHKDVLPACPILPCNHKLIGDGPMQDITTNKHDYVPKHAKKNGPIIPTPNLFNSDCPLSDKTTNRLSYMPVDTSRARVNPIRPKPALDKPTGEFEKNTVQKMSYMPWEPQEPWDKPWAEKKKFSPPTLRMSDNTINKLSYGYPGTFVECDDDDPSCVDCPEEPCDPNAASQPQQNFCCQPCCCPKASC